MGRITSNIGLISGLPITETVDKLMELEARPQGLLVNRNKNLGAEQVAITELTATVLGVQFAARGLASATLYNRQKATSSNTELLTVGTTGNPPSGTYQFTPIRQAQSHQLISSRFNSTTEALGGGSFRFSFGGFLNQPLTLDRLNGGQGVAAGQIRITDRSGASAVIDLRGARSVDDVLAAINKNTDINMTASVQGDRFVLTDNTGSTTANLQVKQFGSGTTAADLGLAGINVAADSASGQDVLSLYGNLKLSDLNDGSGVSLNRSVADLEVTFRDNSSPLSIDFLKAAVPASQSVGTTTAANGSNAVVTFTAVNAGADFDNVTIKFINSGSVTVKGQETVVYDNSDPENKTLTFDIAAGLTDAADIASALASHPTASQLFIAQAGGTGLGKITITDQATTSGGAAIPAGNETTLQHLVNTINAADPTRLSASIGSDGIILTDLTADNGGTFSVSSAFGGTAAEDLGMATSSAGNTISGARLLGGLQTTLLSSLKGGFGLGTLGQLELTDRSGATASVELSGAETVDDILELINASGLGITAQLNGSRSGILLQDTTGLTSSNLIVASGDANNSAEKLGIAINSAVAKVDGGSLDKQTISETTLLSEFRGGLGVTLGSIRIADANGGTATVNLNTLEAKAIGDVIDAINALTIGVEARMNDRGDGIALIDTSGGSGTLTVTENGSTTAANLGLLGTAETIDIEGQPTQVIAGHDAYEFTLTAEETLEDLVTKINASGGFVTADLFHDGTGHRLTLLSQVSGQSGEVRVETGLAASFSDLVKPQDALLAFGEAAGGVVLASSTNTFRDIVPGLSLTVNGSSSNPIAVTVSNTDAPLVTGVKLLVTQYNALRDKLDTLTFFNEVDETAGVLFGSNVALRIETELASVFSGRIFGAGSIRSLGEIGISFQDDGKITLDEERLKQKFADDPEAVTQFFTQENSGAAARIDRLVETFAGADSSLLINRAVSLQRKIEVNQERIDLWDVRLANRRQRLLKQFTDLEAIIAKLQSGLEAVSSIQALPPLTLSSRNRR